jgi:hypothetical protein
MFDSIKELASKVSKNASVKTLKSIPLTTSFVQELSKAGLRLTYAALADASEALGEHTPSGLSAGQRGSSIVGHLPQNLQPTICRSNGKYKKGTAEIWASKGIEAPGGLLQQEFIRPESVANFVTAFLAAAGQEAQEAETTETDD